MPSAISLLPLLLGCADAQAAPELDPAAIQQTAAAVFSPLPDYIGEPRPEAMIDLGRMLYYETRLSKNHDISCNSCHDLARYGVDNEPTSPGHKGVRGGRNSPSTLNAALHATQFWDGRSPDVEDQAKGPILNPVEMAMADGDAVVAVLKSIPGYAEAFRAAWPGEADPITYDHVGEAIGAFERGLVSPSGFDSFLGGDLDALSSQEIAGLKTFVEVGCAACHNGPAVGGQGFFKLGQVRPFETADPGREAVTGQASDRGFFKPPGLRNVAKTGPYLHDGSFTDLPHVVHMMGMHQLGRKLSDQEITDIVAFLESLTGEVDADYVKKPALPESGPDTPAPDPS